MNSAALKQRLRQVDKRTRDLQFWCKLGAVWAAAGLLGLGVSLIERRTGWSSVYALPAIASLGLLGAAVLMLRRKQVEPDWRGLAARVETRYPELDGRLLTAVQQHPKSGEETYLQQRLESEVLAHGKHNDWAEAMPLSRLRTAQWAHLLALLLFAGSLLGLRVTQRQVLVTHNFGSGFVEVSPGDTNLESGTPLIVLARFNGPLPATVDLVLSSAASTSQRLPLTRSLADPVFGGSAPDVKTNLVYHLEYAGMRTRDYRVGIFEYPRLERADATVTFPEYTGQAAKKIDNTRRVSAVEGSLLDLALQLNKPVASARLVLRDKPGPPVPLQPLAQQPTASLSHFSLETNATYRLELRDAEGRTNKVPAEFVFNVLPNRRPEIHLASPRGDVRPSPLEEVTFSGNVWDDFGIKAYGIGYAMVGQQPQTIELGSAVPGQQKREFQHVLRLEELGVEPDQLISWFVWADDVGPDGQVRRTMGDLYFAEVRPFEEVFREGQGNEGGAAGGGGGGGSPSGQLADLEKQIISATWNLQRKGENTSATPQKRNVSQRPGRQSSLPKMLNRTFVFGAVPPDKDSNAENAALGAARGNRVSGAGTNSVASDPEVVRDAQAQALEQAETAMQRQRDQRATALWSETTKKMEEALDHLSQAGNSTNALEKALAAEQSAYQSLLKLQEHEYQVTRSRRNQGGGGRQQQMQRQLEQMDLTQSEDRYETMRQAQAPQASQQREQLQVASRLQELARRQQDLNDRLQELQTALQEARTEQEREEIRRRLKRLEEEEQQMLADMDELQQRMDRPENQSQMSQQRQQLEQTRNDVQRAAEAAGQGSASQALASGTRAQRQLQQIRDQLRQRTSSQFANDLREMRNQARELSRQQDELAKQMEAEAQGAGAPKSLSDSPQRQAMLDRLAQQKQQTTNLMDKATQISQQAEQTEPLLSEQLYDTIRKFSQDTSKGLAESQDQLLNQGLMTRSLYDRLKESTEPDSSKMFDLTKEMLQQDLLPQAQGSGGRLRTDLENLKHGVEHAAESVLGDDTQALRLAREELDKLADQLQQEMAQDRARAAGTNQANAAAQGSPGSGTNGAPSGAGELAQAGSENSQPGSQNSQGDAQNSQAQNSQSGSQNAQSGDSNQNNPSNSPVSGSSGAAQANSQRRAGGSRLQPGALTENGGGSRRLGLGAQAGGTGGADISGSLGANWDRFLDANANQAGPLTGDDFVPWSETLREVEQMVDQTDLRNQVATARERARLLRQQFRTDRQKPDWVVVKTQVYNPLVEVRDRIAEELARRESRENLAPLDRDPVPTRYSDLVRRYYEELGKGRK
jgi:hypothetical protein